MTKPILCYWDIRVIAEPIRYHLHYKKVDFEDKRYPAGYPGYDEWQRDKLKVGQDFPVLPYYIEGDLKLSHNIVVMRYLGYKHGLSGNTGEEKRRVVVVEHQSIDFHDKLRSFIGSREFQTGKEGNIESVQPMFQQWEKFLGDRQFMAGDLKTYVDFMVYEALDHYRIYNELVLYDYRSLEAYFNRMRNLSEIQDYIKSTVRIPWPVLYLNPYYGGSGDPPKDQ